MPKSTRSRSTAGALTAGLLLLVAFTGLRKIRAPDYWWHLSTGRWIAENWSVPHVDVFTYTVKGAPYLDIHWLFQLGLFGVYSLVGHEGVVIARALLIAMMIAILATVGWRRERPFVTAMGLGLVILAGNDRFLVRPELTSFVLLGAILALLERDTRKSDSWIYAVVPFQLLWVNTHGLFALGLVTCAIYTTGAAIRSARGGGGSRRLRRLSTLTLLVALSSLANPNFLAGAFYPLEQLGMISPAGAAGAAKFSVGELVPLWRSDLISGAFTPAILLALLCTLSLAANWRESTTRIEHVLLFVAFFGLFAIANRNVAVFAVVAGPLLIRNTNEFLDRHSRGGLFDSLCSAAVLVLLLGASWDLARGSFYERTRSYNEPGLGYIDLFVAEGAADWIARERPPGRIAHSMVLGGYLNWRLHPDYDVMVDGRLEVYGPRMLSQLALKDSAAFRRLDRKYGFGSVILTSAFDSPTLIAWLQSRPEWRLVQIDIPAVLFVRTDPENDSRWPAIDVRSPDLLPEPFVELPISREAHARARLRLLSALGQSDSGRTDPQPRR